mmetsp:Transcript_52874/g.141277  ORF Transcript_52874/g.141277 Transcript_52874/m.141277 type:complete len:224 (+) Transcript_52874:918-1589(+)
MKSSPRTLCQLTHVFDGVNHAVWVSARRSDNCNSVSIDEAGHVLQVRLLCVGHSAGLSDGEIQVLTCLPEGSVCGCTHNNVWFCDTPGHSLVPVRLHGDDDALSAAGRVAPTTPSWSVVEIDDHLHHLRVHLPQGWMACWMQRVRVRPLGVEVTNEFAVFRASMINSSCCLSLVCFACVGLGPLIHQLRELLPWHPLHRKTCGWRRHTWNKLFLNVKERLVLL